MEQSFVDENVVIRNNETLEIYMDDEIMEENWNARKKTSRNPKNEKKKTNEDKLKKIACIKKNLATTWKIIFVLEFLSCQ
jgi:hypothetical protein